MMKSVLAAVVFALSFSSFAFADDQQGSESKSSIKIDDAAQQKNKVSGDIDEEITNAKLRAESGSKSKWSGSLTAAYNGSSLAKPFDKDRPNTNEEATPPRVYLGGLLGMRYRMTKNDSIQLGTGYQIVRPFHDGKKGNVYDPYVAHNHAGKIGSVQSLTATMVQASTDTDELKVGQRGLVDVAQTFMYDFHGSRFSAGLALEAIYQNFGKNKNELVTDPDGKIGRVGYGQRDWILGAYPLAEYAVNDKITLRTVFRPFIFNHAVLKTEEGDSGWSKARWTQSIGVGIAVTRDVYLYPNFQYDWYQWQGDDFNWFRRTTRNNSTVNLSATINMF